MRGSGIAVDVVGGGLCYHKIHGIEKVLEKKLEMDVACCTHGRCVIIPSSFTWLNSWKERRQRAPSRVGSGAWSNHVEPIE